MGKTLRLVFAYLCRVVDCKEWSLFA